MQNNLLIALVIFIVALLLGMVCINSLPFGYTDSALLYLSAILAAGAFWVGRER